MVLFLMCITLILEMIIWLSVLLNFAFIVFSSLFATYLQLVGGHFLQAQHAFNYGLWRKDNKRSNSKDKKNGFRKSCNKQNQNDNIRESIA